MMGTCSTCNDLHKRTLAWDANNERIYGAYLKGADISATADGGCQGCELIRTILFELAHVDISEDSHKERTIYLGASDNILELFSLGRDNLYRPSSFNLFPGDDRSLLDGKPSRISGDTSSNEAFKTARAWLDNCVTNHTQCKTSDVLPRRVIDVGELDTEDLPKLIEFCETRREKYACLSYCWGRDPEANIRTTKSTLSQRKSGIEWKDIPATITDAIIACRKLGIRFLWIDALCIIQDDVQDWALECTNMATIYSNSYITLAAVAAQDPARGMFKRPLVNEYRSTDHNVQIAGSKKTATISARKALAHRKETDPKSPSDSEICPLMMRAWVLQEMLLSPRILRFNMHELSWECREIMTCECSRMSYKSATSLIHQLSSYECSVPDEEYFHRWRDIVSSFSSRDITHESDRLPAISAIARKFSLVGGKYFAGIWEKDLIRGLLWTCWDPHITKQLDKSAPSWSWASSHTRVAFVYDDYKEKFVLQEQAKVRDVHCIPATENKFGSVLGGSITLSGRLIQVLVTFIKGTGIDPSDGFIDINLPRPFRDVDTRYHILEYNLRDDKILSDPSAAMYALLLASNLTARRDRPVHYSLLLRKFPSDEYLDAYERLGLLHECCPEDKPSTQLNWSLFPSSTEETITII